MAKFGEDYPESENAELFICVSRAMTFFSFSLLMDLYLIQPCITTL